MAFRGERYETLRVIASGGMATVHLGRALGAGGFERLVAIKVMHPHLATEPEFTAMFLDEARLAARIRHPNVVSTLDVQADEEGVFLVMDYIEGPSLQQIFRALSKGGGAMPLEIFFRIFFDTLAGLHAAHELKDAADRPLHLVHRDVSPQNILVGTDGIARITDFGVASAEARLSSTSGGQLKGKLGYMAPEQARSQPVDRRTDIYAAGVILWEVLAGGRRFRSGNEAALLATVTEGVVRPLRDVNPSVAEPLEACCLKALAPAPEDRYATGADFVEALESAAVASGIEVASGRRVAAFVTGLEAHARPVDLPAAPQSSRASIDFPGAYRRSLPEIPPAVPDPSQQDTVHTVPEARASVADRSQASVSPLPHMASEASIPFVAPTPRGASRRLLWGLLGVVLVGLVAFFVAQKRGPSAGSGATDSGSASGGARAVSSQPAPFVPPAPSPPLPPASAPAVPSDAAPNPSSPVAPSGAVPALARPLPAVASASASSGRAAPPDASKPGHDRAGDKPVTTSPVYRPPDL